MTAYLELVTKGDRLVTHRPQAPDVSGMSNPHGGHQGYAQGPDPYYQQHHGRQAPPAPRRRRRVWPWVLLALVVVPILGFVACTAMVGGAISAVDQAQQGGTVPIGQTFTYQSGLAIGTAAPTPHDAGNEFIVAAEEQAYEVLVTVTNGTPDPVGAALITTNATVNNMPAVQVFDGAAIPTQDIAPGQSLTIPFRFKVAQGTSGPLQIAVSGAFNEPVFFTGQL